MKPFVLIAAAAVALLPFLSTPSFAALATPTTISSGGWNYWPVASSDGSVVAALKETLDVDYGNEQIVVMEKGVSGWSSAVLAGNGWRSTDSFQWMPQETHPVVSGDGSTIAYLGTQATGVDGNGKNIYRYDIYISRKGAEGWSTPQAVPTGKENHHYRVALSSDGNTLAFADYPNPFGGTMVMHVTTWSGGAWSTPVAISDPNTGGAWSPTLNAAGTRLAWEQNNNICYSEKVDGVWSLPQQLTNYVWTETGQEEAVFPIFSGDGNSLFHWKYILVPGDQAMILTGQDLMVARYSDGTWGTAATVNPQPLLTTFSFSAPVGVNGDGTLVVYPHPVKYEDTITRAYLEAQRMEDGIWGTPRQVTAGEGGYELYPTVTADGTSLVYNGTDGTVRTVSLSGNVISPTNRITVSLAGVGAGSVASGTAIACGDDCEEEYAEPTTIQLQAVPAEGSYFAGWSGACEDSTALRCSVRVEGSVQVSALFQTQPYLFVEKYGSGKGSVSFSTNSCGDDCEQAEWQTKYGQRVVVRAKTDASSTFLGWGGACSSFGTKTTCTLTMDQDLTVEASFGYPEAAVAESVDFGSVPVKVKTARTLVIENNGSGILKIRKAVVEGTSRTYFSVKGISSKTVPAQGSSTISLTFLPKEAAEIGATLRIYTNDPVQPEIVVPLSGTGVLPTVDAIEPDHAAAGETIIISGGPFAETLTANTVTFAGRKKGKVTAVSEDLASLTVTVPLGARSGAVTVAVGPTKIAAGSFTVDP